MSKSWINGNECYFDGERWRYLDGVPISQEVRPCPKCGEMPTAEGHDACLGHIEGAIFACCGHGVSERYIVM